MSIADFRPVIRETARQWPVLILTAGLDALIGILALAWPGVTVLALALLLGVLLLFSGATSVAMGLRLRRAGVSSGTWPIVLGVVSIIAGLICLGRPGTGVAAIAIATAFWFLLHGVADLGRGRLDPRHRTWWTVLGVLGIVVAVVLFLDARAAVLTVAIVIGIGFLMRSGAELGLALQLRRLARAPGDVHR